MMTSRTAIATRAYATLTLAFSWTVLTPRAFAADVETLAIGAKAPDFNLQGVDGQRHALKDFDKSKVLAVVFTCNHCPTAQLYEGRIMKLVKDFSNKSVAFVAISPNDPEAVRPDELGYTDLNDSFEEMKIRAKMRKFNFPYLFGGGEFEKASMAYGPRATPHIFVFDEKRTLRYTGRLDDSEHPKKVKRRDAREAISALLKNKPVKVPTNRAFGCSVKWSDKREGVKAYWDRLAKEPIAAPPLSAKALASLRKNQLVINGEQEKKFRLVNFWATWCGPCVTEFPELMEIHRQYSGRAFEVVTIAAQDEEDKPKVEAFLKRHKAHNPNFILAGDDKYAAFEAFDPKWTGSLPYTVLLDPNGKVLFKATAAVDGLALKGKIVEILNQHAPW